MTNVLEELPRHPRSRIRRYSKLQSYDRAELERLLDESFLAHVGFLSNGSASVIPMGYAREGDALLVHGSTRAGMMSAGAARVPLTVTVTLLDGLVYAPTLFDSTFNFRSAVLQGHAETVSDPPAKLAALRVLSERIMPGRWEVVPALTAQQDAATLVVRFHWDVVSLKCRSGPPDGEPSGELWTGTVPLRLIPGAPESQPGTTYAVPSSVSAWTVTLARNAPS